MKKLELTKQLKGQATPEQISKWKAENLSGIYAIKNESHIAYFRNPTRIDMNAALAKADDTPSLDVIEELAAITHIGGADDMLENDTLFFGVMKHLRTKMEGSKAELVNL